jgi:hypothetical protein
MARSKSVSTEQGQASELVQAFREAIEATRPPEKKNPFTRKKNTPWTPKDGSPKLKLKRKLFQHSIPVDEEKLTNEQIVLANKLRPGVYFDGWVKVVRRRDKGIDIDYPVRSAQQRLKLSSVYGIRSFTELLQKINDEASRPRKSEFDVAEDE